jgi:hypothetical protein
MKILWLKTSSYRKTFREAVVLVASLAVATPAFAQANSPWENAVGVLQQAFIRQEFGGSNRNATVHFAAEVLCRFAVPEQEPEGKR